VKKLVFSSITALSLVSGSAFAQGGTSTTAQPDPKLAAQCQKVIPTIQKTAENILKIKESAKRKVEFEKLGKTIPQGCEPFMQPLAQQIMAKEKAMYPDQPLASAPGQNNQQGQANNGGQPNQQGQANNGGQPSTANQPGSMGQPDPKLAEKCQKVIPTIQKTAENILKIKESAKRKVEFEKLAKRFPKAASRSFSLSIRKSWQKKKPCIRIKPSLQPVVRTTSKAKVATRANKGSP